MTKEEYDEQAKAIKDEYLSAITKRAKRSAKNHEENTARREAKDERNRKVFWATLAIIAIFFVNSVISHLQEKDIPATIFFVAGIFYALSIPLNNVSYLLVELLHAVMDVHLTTIANENCRIEHGTLKARLDILKNDYIASNQGSNGDRGNSIDESMGVN